MTNTYDNADHPRNQVLKDGKWIEKAQTPGDMKLTGGPYTSSSPAECDTELADLFEKRGRAAHYLRGYVDQIKAHEAELAYRAAHDGKPLHRWDVLHDYDRANVELGATKLRSEIAELDTLIKPIDAEYAARGGWTRFFLVKASNGHIHSSMSCTTCFTTTQYGWLPEQSGSDEAETVELAGDAVCTICFPSAPVADKKNPRPNQLETTLDREYRLVQETAKAAKAAKKLATGIANPDGSELCEASKSGRSGYPIKTERTAELKAVDILYNTLLHDHQTNSSPRSPLAQEDYERDQRTFDNIIPALAAKRGQDVDVVREFLTAKAGAKFDKWRKGLAY